MKARVGGTVSVYAYNNANWGDQLTAYKGVTFTYDEIGNPETYYNGISWTFTWSQGRRLATASGNGYVLSFTYNDEGIRTTKTVDDTVYTYRLNGSQIVAEEWTTNGTQYVLVFLYDAEGSPIGMQYRNSLYPADLLSSYWFEKNLQGDIVAVYDAAGTKLISYKYDAWGNFTTTYHNGCTASAAANYNPFRYRGYYYDNELGMYYLQSRYYDPVIGRFINEDVYVSTGQGFIGFNSYAYCLNSPTNLSDPSGRNSIALQSWTIGMGWLPFVDTVLPIGDVIYVGGIIILGAFALAACSDDRLDIVFEETDVAFASLPPLDDDDDDDYYDDDSNFGGRKKIGRKKGDAPTNNQAQNKQFRKATKNLNKAQKKMLHQEITGQGLGYHGIKKLAEELFGLIIYLFLEDD